MAAELGIVVTAVASDLVAYEVGEGNGIGGGAEFYLCHDQPLVFAKELVDFENMVVTTDKPADFVDDTWFAEFHE